MNQYETQLITEKFKKDGFEPALKPEEADVIVLNSCTVTAEADKECEYFIRKSLKLKNKPELILTGCLAKKQSEEWRVKSGDTNGKVRVIADKTALYKNSEKQSIETFDGRSRAFVKIQDGCNSFCSYCIVPYVRNNIWSKPESAVLEEIENLVKNDYSEIVLTGIHVGKWQAAAITNYEWNLPPKVVIGGITNQRQFTAMQELKLSDLIGSIVRIPLDFRIRISSIELNEIDDALINLMLKYPDKICRHLHIPLQSGSDEVLKNMNRHYDSAAFEKKVKEIMRLLPDIALTTDVITGFPGETEANHKETVNFIERNPFARLHVFRYSDREGTKASAFPNKVAPEEIKRRSKELFEIDAEKRNAFLSKNIGQKRKAVAIGNGKALTDNYITVNLPAGIAEKPKGIFEAVITERVESEE